MYEMTHSSGPRRCRRLGSLAAVLLALALVPVPSAAQTPESAPPTGEATPTAQQAAEASTQRDTPLGEFVDTIEVRIQNVPVYVRDKKTGLPVTGLSKDDFVLLEDGKPVTITNFYEINGGERYGDPGEAEPPPVSSHPELRRVSRRTVPQDQQLHVIVYIDHFNIRPFNRNRVFRYVRQFLRESTTRQDRIMLVSYNRSLKVERAFTSDSQVISNALFELEKHTGGRTQWDSERRDLLRDIVDSRDPMSVYGRIRLFAESLHNDMQFTLDAMDELVTSLGGLPGRKALIYVSDGLPMRAGEEMFEAAATRWRESFTNTRLDSLNYDSSRRFRIIADAASANGVSFYTIDASGLLGRSLSGADMNLSEMPTTNLESMLNSNEQSPLMFLADETGGQAVVNTNNYRGGFEKIGQDFDHYYSLGFSPSGAGRGRRHKLKVEVNGKRVDVRFPRTYRDKSIETAMADTTSAALLYGYQSNPLDVELVQADVIPRSDGNYIVHLDVRIPIGKVVLLPRPSGHEGLVRVWVQAADRDGGLSDVQSQPVPIRVKEGELEQAQASYYTYTMPLMMRQGEQRISIGVRDDVGAKTSFVSRTLRVGA